MTTQREFAVPKDKQLVTVHLVGASQDREHLSRILSRGLDPAPEDQDVLEDANRFFPLTAEGTTPHVHQ